MEGSGRTRFGPFPPGRPRLLIHDCRDRTALVFKGLLPSGGPLWLNSKSVLPGSAGERTVYVNHCARFIADPAARAGYLAGNPVHGDMVYAARAAGPKPTRWLGLKPA